MLPKCGFSQTGTIEKEEWEPHREEKFAIVRGHLGKCPIVVVGALAEFDTRQLQLELGRDGFE